MNFNESQFSLFLSAVQFSTSLAISSTAIRATIAAADSPRYLLPDAVLDYIRVHNLYL